MLLSRSLGGPGTRQPFILNSEIRSQNTEIRTRIISLSVAYRNGSAADEVLFLPHRVALKRPSVLSQIVDRSFFTRDILTSFFPLPTHLCKTHHKTQNCDNFGHWIFVRCSVVRSVRLRWPMLLSLTNTVTDRNTGFDNFLNSPPLRNYSSAVKFESGRSARIKSKQNHEDEVEQEGKNFGKSEFRRLSGYLSLQWSFAVSKWAQHPCLYKEDAISARRFPKRSFSSGQSILVSSDPMSNVPIIWLHIFALFCIDLGMMCY